MKNNQMTRTIFTMVTIPAITLAFLAAAEPGNEGGNPESQTSLKSSGVQAFARASDRFLNLLVERHVTREQYMQEVVLGTLTSGPVRLDGRVTVELVPHPNQAAFDIRLVGKTECRNHVGKRGPVTIFSSAEGYVDVRKRVLIGLDGVQSRPATAQSTATVQIHNITAQNRLIERIAWRRANRMHPEIEQAAAETSGSRTELQLDQELMAPLSEADKVLTEKFGDSWSKQSFPDFPWNLTLSSTPNSLHAMFVGQDGTEVSAPDLPQLNWDVFLGVHETCFEQFFQSSLAGRTIPDTEFLDTVLVVTGNSPRALWVHDRTDRWSVVAAQQQPVTGSFAKNRLGVTFRIQEVTRGTDRLARPIEVAAEYALEVTPDGPHLIRQGDLTVRFADDDDVTDQHESIRQFVYKKFNGLFQSEIYFDGLVPPAGGSLGKLRALRLQELACRNGWLTIGYQLPPDAGQVADVGR
jgi:hypothetical protein